MPLFFKMLLFSLKGKLKIVQSTISIIMINNLYLTLILNTFLILQRSDASQLLRAPNIILNSESGNRARAACLGDRSYAGLQNGVEYCKNEVAYWLRDIDKDILEFNVLTADFAWEISVNPDNPDLAGRGAQLDGIRSKWRRDVCEKVSDINLMQLEPQQKRQFYLLCRGATLDKQETESLSIVLDNMQTIYTSSKVCFPRSNASKHDSEQNIDSIHDGDILEYLNSVNTIVANYEKSLNVQDNDQQKEAVKMSDITDYKTFYENNSDSKHTEEKMADNDDVSKEISPNVISLAAKMAGGTDALAGNTGEVCLTGEPQLERLLARSRQPAALRWGWLAWREKVGPPMRPLYPKMVAAKNAAAKRAGYNDLGEIWREELEMPNLQHIVDKLYQETSGLYSMLHAVARFFLRRFYGASEVSENGPIPAHLLGNMWAQNWETILGIILPEAESVDLDKVIRETNWTTHDMVKRAEDFYTSIGLAAMTDKFWKYSYFGESNQNNSSPNSTHSTDAVQEKRAAKCHGTAANMFEPEDYRMIYCAGLSMEDFYVIHHEMGHIEYYMSYDQGLPTIFKDGTNTAFQESVGDAIMYAVMTPQHLQRLGLIKDNLVYLYLKPKNQRPKNTQNIKKNKRMAGGYGHSKNNEISFYNEEVHVPPLNDKSDYDSIIETQTLNNLNKIIQNIEEYNDIPETQPLYYNWAQLNLDWTDDVKVKRNVNDDVMFNNLKIEDIRNDLDEDLELTEDINIQKGDGINMNGIDFDSILLLRQALTKIPQIPFGYIIDKYRWDIFSGKIQPEDYNRAYWDYVRKFQGVEPPGGAVRGEEYFDAGAKFHIPDNTPYVRYYLSSFLQVQMFRAMCQWSLFGDASPNLQTPMPLHRCDVYGSKKAGKKLREMMSKGSSVHWSTALKILTGNSHVSSDALLLYYKPLQNILHKVIDKFNIPVGW